MRKAILIVCLALVTSLGTTAAIASAHQPSKSWVHWWVAKMEAKRLGIVGVQWVCLESLVTRENAEPPKTWDPQKWNGAGSGAYGLPQALPGYKMSSEGPDWKINAATQIRWMIKYAKGRYDGVCQADRFQRSHGYY